MSQMPVTQNAAAQLAIFANPDALETVREIMSSEDFSASDLDRIKVPGAGGLMWEIPTAEGSRDSREIRGIILLSKTGRAYWQSKYSGENSKPDCVSLDGQCGTGNPGGQCAACPFNQYESAAEGAGKACKETRTLLVLQEDELIPTVLRVPPVLHQGVEAVSAAPCQEGAAPFPCRQRPDAGAGPSPPGASHTRRSSSPLPMR